MGHTHKIEHGPWLAYDGDYAHYAKDSCHLCTDNKVPSVPSVSIDLSKTFNVSNKWLGSGGHVQVRSGGPLGLRSFWLDAEFDWMIVRDGTNGFGGICLVPMKKGTKAG